MAGLSQKTSSWMFPLYKICCSIPQETDQNETIYLSSASEFSLFLQEHGIGERRYREKYGSYSIPTCTDQLSNGPQIVNHIRNQFNKDQCNQQNDQINSNLKNAKNISCHINDVVTWHRCNKNESLVHFCKKSKSSLYHNDADKTPITDDNYKKLISKNIKSTLKKKNSKIIPSFRSEILLNAFRKQKKKSDTLDQKMNHEVLTGENNMSDLLDASDDLNCIGIPHLTESVVCETATELEDDAVYSEEVKQVIAYSVTKTNASTVQDVAKPVNNGLIINVEEVHQKDVKKVIAYDLEVNASLSSHMKLNDTNDTKTEWLDTISEECITSNFQCSDQSKCYTDQTFYVPPKKFLEEISDWVMKYFIDKESDAPWLKAQKNEKISKNLLGIDKDLSELHILKKITKHHPLDCLLSALTPRQKRLLASGIFKSLENFKITGHSWGEMAQEVLKIVCKTFKSQREFIV